MAVASIDIIRRTHRTITVTVTDDDGDAVNITGYTVYFTVRETPDSESTLINKTVTSHSNAAGGISSVSLSSTDTNIAEGSYYYQFGIKNASNEIVKTAKGKFNVDQDVNQES